MASGDGDGLNTYPRRKHLLSLAPLVLCLLLVFGVLGSEEVVERCFFGVRTDHPVLTTWMEGFASFGNVGYYLVYAGIICAEVRMKRKEAVPFVIGYAVGLIVTLFLVETVKITVGRPRPQIDGDFLAFSVQRAYQSFPSGHVSGTIVTVLPLALRHGRILLPLLFGFSPALMGLARIYLGEHHPSDLLGSMILGSFGVYLSWYVCQTLERDSRWFLSSRTEPTGVSVIANTNASKKTITRER